MISCEWKIMLFFILFYFLLMDDGFWVGKLLVYIAELVICVFVYLIVFI